MSSAAMSEGLLDVARTVAEARPLLAILIDDLQWADPATLDLLAYVARSTGESPILMIFAARLQETPAEAPLRRMLTPRTNSVAGVAFSTVHLAGAIAIPPTSKMRSISTAWK